MMNCLILLFVFAKLVGSQREFEACIERSSQTAGTCRKVSQCESAREDFRINGVYPTFCSPGVREPVVCCKDGPNITQTTPRPQPVIQATDGLRISERKCQQYSRGVTQNIDYISLLPEPEVMSLSIAKCYYDNTVLIVGGKDAELGEFPHMGALAWRLDSGGLVIKCGASLVSESFALTAGHCLKVAGDTTVSSSQPEVVILGEHNINPDVEDGARPVQVDIKRLIAHPSYRPPQRYHDIALIELVEPVSFGEGVRPACLWTEDVAPPTAVAVGWGVTNTRTNQQSEVLQKVSLDIIDNARCDLLLSRSKNRLWSGFVREQLCAGVLAGSKDTCRGDSGGPLQSSSPQNRCVARVVGVTSFGGACAAVDQPAVYTRVSEYVDWIESVVWPQG